MKTVARPCVCLVTSRRQLAPDARTVRAELVALDAWLDDAIGRVNLIQIREPGVDAGPLTGLARRVAARARDSQTVVVVNDRADVARAAGADGVHLPASGLPTERVRRFEPPGWIVGRSIHGVDEARTQQMADYLILGTVFPSASKPAGSVGQGLARLGEVVRASVVPVLAIGGIDPARARQCLDAGAAGVAAISVFLPPGRAPGAMGIRAAVEALALCLLP